MQACFDTRFIQPGPVVGERREDRVAGGGGEWESGGEQEGGGEWEGSGEWEGAAGMLEVSEDVPGMGSRV